MSVSGIGFSVFLITLILSLFRGWQERVGGFVEKVPADVWVAREGTTDFLNAASILPDDVASELVSQEGVRAVHPLVVRPMNFSADGTEVDVQLVGFDPDSGVGGPLKVERGQGVPGPGEIVVDAGTVRRFGSDVGDVLENSGREFRIVGVSSGGNFVFRQVSFMTLDSARELLGMEGLSTFYLLELEDPSQIKEVVSAIEADNPGLQAFTSTELADATRHLVLRNIIPILAVILVLAFVVGVAITGLTIYTATVEKAREFGILRAVGFSNGYLYRVVIEQSLITGLVGFVGGVILNVVVGRFAEDLVPQFVILVRWTDVAAVLGITLAMSALAALLPVRRLAGIDPVEVFKA